MFDNRKITLDFSVDPQAFDDLLGRIATEVLQKKPNLTLLELRCKPGDNDTNEIIQLSPSASEFITNKIDRISMVTYCKLKLSPPKV